MLLLLLLAYYRDERKHLNNTIIITKINLSKFSSEINTISLNVNTLDLSTLNGLVYSIQLSERACDS